MLLFPLLAVAATLNSPKPRDEAVLTIDLAVSKVTEHKDATLVFGGYPCLHGKITKVEIAKKSAHEPGTAPKVGEELTIAGDCQPDDLPLGPGQTPRETCSKIRAAKAIRAYSRSLALPKAASSPSCPFVDFPVEVLK